MEHGNNEMNQVVKAKEPVVRNKNEPVSSFSSPSHRIPNITYLNLEKYSKWRQTNLCSTGKSNIVCEEWKNGHIMHPRQKDVNTTLQTQTTRDTQNKMSASNSLFRRCSNVYSKKTPIEQNILGQSLSFKENEIGCNVHYQHTKRRGSFEEKYQKHSSSTRHRTNAKEEIKVCDAVENSYKEKPKLMKNNGTCTREKPHVIAICGKRFEQKRHLKQHDITHTTEKTCVCKFCGNEYKLRRGLEKHVCP
ncbi:zinc finger protein [Trichonephila clavata]|uniref:Zinc finger protein n=1 Tax=Trichonephila clavata TaxID=2740835 RepID=A0A8X6JIG1_TRICU|nr:zinc finger protein [Trichonephila clavata]